VELRSLPSGTSIAFGHLFRLSGCCYHALTRFLLHRPGKTPTLSIRRPRPRVTTTRSMSARLASLSAIPARSSR
jgi:hypothetical protein